MGELQSRVVVLVVCMVMSVLACCLKAEEICLLEAGKVVS